MARHNIYTFLPKGYHASYYYRVFVPLKTLEELGFGVRPLFDDMAANVDVQKRVIALTHSDINLMYQPVGEGLSRNMDIINEWKAVPDGAGDWRYPPSFIVDTDDNVFDVSPLNHSYKELGIRSPSGATLEPGAEISMDDGEGKRRILYKDGVDGFDVLRNQEMLERYRTIARKADAVTCTTPRVLEYVNEEIGPAMSYVFPNSIRFDHYTPFKDVHVVKDNPKTIRVLWQGSPTHYEDLYPWRHALSNVCRRNPNIKIILWGSHYSWLTENIPSEQIEVIKWVDYSLYRLRLATIAHDINLCPLKDTRFNRSRSAIKFYESTALPNPVATLAQRTGAYADDIQDGRTGMLWDNPADFTDKLLALADDAALRKELATNAKDWLTDNRDAFKTVHGLFEFYEQVREAKKSRTLKMSPEEAAENRRMVDESEGKNGAVQAEHDHAGVSPGTDS